MSSPDSPDAAVSAAEGTTPLGLVNRFFLTFIGLGLVAAACCASELRHVATVFLWALACLAVGAFVGLLFGIPRMRQRNAAKAEEKDTDPKYQAEVNNNLIEVSDWLTKIIVGVGLIELTSIPGKLRDICTPLAESLGTQGGLAAAVAIVVYFMAAGFLAGYINSRTFIAVMFRKSDDQLLAAQVTQLKSELRQSVAVQQAQQVTAELKSQTLQELFASQPGAASALAPEAASGEAIPAPDAELVRMAESYRTVEHPERSVRVRRKEDAASQMLRHLIKSRIPRRSLYAWVKNNPSDGMIIALASLIVAAPKANDLPVLLSVADKADWFHVRYRVTLAFGSLLRADFGSVEEWTTAREVLTRYIAEARRRWDESLISVANEAVAQIDAKFPSA